MNDSELLIGVTGGVSAYNKAALVNKADAKRNNKPIVSWIVFWGNRSRRMTLWYADRVGGGLATPVLPHHRTYGSVYGGSD